MRSSPAARVLILGGGITGCLTACLLDDLGVKPVIVEQLERVMDGASRWNDGKLHLGYTFIGTESLATARLMQRGAGTFLPIVERAIGSRVSETSFGKPTIYVVDPDSIFDPETLWNRASRVAQLLATNASTNDQLRRFATPKVTLLERLDPEAASAETGQKSIVAAWRTTERHISTAAVASDLRSAVAARGIHVVHQRVESVAEHPQGWRVALADGSALVGTVVVNALWESRARIDEGVVARDPSEPPVTIRYKRALFGTSSGLSGVTSSTRILGKFGDIATYANGDAYVSWYPVALAARSDNGVAPIPETADDQALTKAMLAGLGLPADAVATERGNWQVRGGYVVAPGSGDIDQRRSLLHTRHRVGVRELRPGYISVDTGKYTVGPLFARRASVLAARRARATIDSSASADAAA